MMHRLPVESPDWLSHFRSKIALERSVIQTLIQWGFTDAAFDIQRKLDESFSAALESYAYRVPVAPFQLPNADRAHIREALQEVYLKTREIPRRRGCEELLHNAHLSGFKELESCLVQLYEGYLQEVGPAFGLKAA